MDGSVIFAAAPTFPAAFSYKIVKNIVAFSLQGTCSRKSKRNCYC